MQVDSALYGLKQSPRAWFNRIDTYLTASGFEKNPSDNNVYKLQDPDGFVLLAFYVDDTVLVSNNPQGTMSRVKRMLSSAFAMGDLGDLHSFLGTKIEQSWQDCWISLNQSAYIEQVLTKYNMSSAKPVHTPMAGSAKLTSKSSPKTKEEIRAMALIPYRQACGSLEHLQVSTRLDISKATSTCCQFFQNPGNDHWTAVKRIMRYLEGTQNLGLIYRQQQNGSTENQMLRLVGFTDSGWAGDAEQRRSTTAYAVMAISAPLSWSSKRLQTICLSSIEVEYAACTKAAKELVSHQKFAEGLGRKYEHPTDLMCDSQSAIALSQNPIYHARTKHIEIKHHYIRQLISEGEVALRYVATEENVADVLTKPLPGPLHHKHVKSLGLSDITLEKAHSRSHMLTWKTTRQPLRVRADWMIENQAELGSKCTQTASNCKTYRT